MISNKGVFIFYSVVSILFSMEYVDYEFEIFSIITDARTNSLGGIAASNSMSIDNIYSLNEFHKKGTSLFSYGQSYSGVINYFQISRIVLDSQKSKLAISLLHKQIDDIPDTEGAWVDLGGDINQSDIDYDNITSYSDQQFSLIFLYSYDSQIGDIGIKIKPFYTSIIDYNSIGMSIDLGINRNFSDNFMLGLSINNLLSVNKWSTGQVYSLYPSLSSLISYSNNGHLLMGELLISSLNADSQLLKTSYKIGYENNIYKRINFQIGYSSIRSFSLGFSFKHKNKNFSYSITPNLNNIILGHNHQFSILLGLPNNLN